MLVLVLPSVSRTTPYFTHFMHQHKSIMKKMCPFNLKKWTPFFLENEKNMPSFFLVDAAFFSKLWPKNPENEIDNDTSFHFCNKFLNWNGMLAKQKEVFKKKIINKINDIWRYFQVMAFFIQFWFCLIRWLSCCNMQHATFSIQHATCSTQHAPCSTQHATCRMQHASIFHWL